MKKDTDILKETRLRFPPSPTGPLHVGNARTLLFNYLFAKQNKGSVVLRIEDTDRERSKLEWVQNIIDELCWLGIVWDEGPDIGGSFGPYKQSQRTDTYRKYLEKLLAEKKAYHCFCTSEELEGKRQERASRGLAPIYDGACRNLSDIQVGERLENQVPSVIRFHIENKKIAFEDLIRGQVEFDMGLVGDMVIAKSLEEPLYHLAVVVDDYEMRISHVIRGEDHISNTPKQILLQEALGFYRPQYAHLPILLNPDKSKMSKRAGDVAVSDYHAAGYLPEALVNFMALLGWNPGTEKEIFSLKELIKEFSLGKVQKGGAVFNVQKLDSINSYYIRKKSASELVKLCLPYLPETAANTPKRALEKIVSLFQPRLKKLSEIAELSDFFFADDLRYDKALLAWKQMGEGETKKSLEYSLAVLEKIKKWNRESLEKELFKASEQFNAQYGYPQKDKGYLLWPIRVALSGKKASPGPFEIAEAMGREQTIQRMQSAAKNL